jgi:hypothetical protein
MVLGEEKNFSPGLPDSLRITEEAYAGAVDPPVLWTEMTADSGLPTEVFPASNHEDLVASGPAGLVFSPGIQKASCKPVIVERHDHGNLDARA